MKRSKRKYVFIKNYITRNIDSPGRDVEALDTFVKRTISEKNTPFGTESKFAFVVGAEVWPASASKNTKRCVGGCNIEEFFGGCGMVEHFCREKVDEECRGEESFVPKFKSHRCIGK
jgi:hypothetical protein